MLFEKQSFWNFWGLFHKAFRILERDVAQSIACPPLKRSVVESILLSGPSCSFGLFSVPTSGPQLVYQRPWYVLFCLWKSAYKRSLAAYRKE